MLLVRLDGAVLAVACRLLLGGRVQLGGGEGDDGVGVVVRLDGDPLSVDSLGPSTCNNVHIFCALRNNYMIRNVYLKL